MELLHLLRRIENWAALIKKILNSDPLVFPKCGEKMDIVAFIEYQVVIYNILVSMDLWSVSERPPPGPEYSLHHFANLLCVTGLCQEQV